MKRKYCNLYLFHIHLVFYILSPDSISLIFGAQIFHGFFYGIQYLSNMIADVADYSEWKNNRRNRTIFLL